MTMKHLPLIVLLYAGIGSQLLAQVPDAVWDHFLAPLQQDSTYIAAADGYAELYSNGRELSFFIQISDTAFQAEDHLIIWLGLTPDAFAADFPYVSHPAYASPPTKHLRGERSMTSRLFSSLNGIGEFQTTYEAEQPDSAGLTPWHSGELEWLKVPYGLVGSWIRSRP